MPQTHRYFLLIATSFFLLLSKSLAADLYQSHESIYQTTEQFIDHLKAEYPTTGRVAVKINQLDPRLKVAKCDKPLDAFLPPYASGLRTRSIGIRCTGTSTWTLYIPVDIDIFARAVVTTIPLYRGHVIEPGDLTLKEVNIDYLHHEYFENPDELVGKVVKRSVRLGYVIEQNMISEPTAVEKGDVVMITAQKGSLTVTMQGVALSDGSIGDQIRVRNAKSGRVIQATITGPKSVRVVF